MSLQFIMGPSGSGKSHYLYQYVTTESQKHPDQNYIVLVPEQFTLQTQKDLVMASPQKGILNVDVLSFHRLAYRIFEETGGNQRTILDDVGKSLVLRKIAGDYESELRVLGSNLKKSGFISEMKSVISEFTQYDVGRAQLDAVLEAAGPTTNFYYKLQDMQKIYEGFQDYLKDVYVTGEELLDLLSQVVAESSILRNSVIVMDGFTGFTPVQMKLLRELLLVCDKVVVTVTVDKHAVKHPLFALSDQMIMGLYTIASECRQEIENPIHMDQNPVYRFREKDALGFLEANLFRYSRKKYEKEQDEIQMYHAQNPREESEFVAQRIRNLVRTKGLRYREIAVIASDMESYANYIENAFRQYEIPVFMDHKRSILLNSFVEYLRSLLEMAEQNFTCESVFRYLRTNLTGFTQEEVDFVENYCIALGIRGYKKWQEKWVRNTRNMKEGDLEALNDLRERLVKQVETIMAVLKKRSKTVKEVTTALHTFFVEQRLQEKVKEYEIFFAEQGELALEKEYAQVYRIVMELFDQFVELLGEEHISLREYCELLDAGLEEAKVGIIPPSLEQVVVGDVERTRIKDVKVLFFVGMNDAYIPGKGNAGGLLNERDREQFAASKIPLAPGNKERVFIQKFYLYSILTKPSEQIILTYSRNSSDGKSLRPAYVIAELKKMYKGLQETMATKDLWEQELTKERGILYLTEGLQKKEEGFSLMWQQLYSWYKADPIWQEKVRQIVDAAFYHKPTEQLNAQTAEQLYGTILQNSVSRLEKYAACAYAHFLDYGLKLQPREEYQFQAVDLGNLFHASMERFSAKLSEQGYEWTAVSEELQEQLIEESVESSIVDYGNTILYSNARNEYIITRLKRMVRRTVWALTKQLEKGDFRPEAFEMAYDSGRISLEEDKQMRLYGKIDRVDLCETDDDVYVKIVDYKTGAKQFDLGEVYHGIQMQLAVYMHAALEHAKKQHSGKRIVPAGLLYYQMKDPLVEKVADEEQRERDILKELCPNGIVNSEPEVIEHLDRTLQGSSLVIPAAKNKDGSLSKTSNALSTEDFEMLTTFAQGKTRQIGKEILGGNVSADPYLLGDKTQCNYCPYRGVCGFDEKIPGYKYRKLEKLDAKDAIRRMREEVQRWE